MATVDGIPRLLENMRQQYMSKIMHLEERVDLLEDAMQQVELKLEAVAGLPQKVHVELNRLEGAYQRAKDGG